MSERPSTKEGKESNYLVSTLFLIVLDALSFGMMALFWLNPESPALTIQRDMWSIWVAILILAITWWMVFRTADSQLAPQKS